MYNEISAINAQLESRADIEFRVSHFLNERMDTRVRSLECCDEQTIGFSEVARCRTPKSPHPRPLSRKNGRGVLKTMPLSGNRRGESIARRFDNELGFHSKGVTVIEVLFAMFVVLFGLIGIVTLLPMAGRQASDSYSMTQGGAMMENMTEQFRSIEGFAPSSERGWWMADDFTTSASAPKYQVANSLADVYTHIQSEIQKNRVILTPLNSQDKIQALARESFAFGFCIDPLFCSDQFSSGWRYQASYTWLRKSTTQLLFRRTRFPFFDEDALIDGNFTTGAVDYLDLASGSASSYSTISPVIFPGHSNVEFPRLIRVSFPSNQVGAGGQALPIPRPIAELLVASLGDVIQAIPEEDQGYGSLRGFLANGGGFVSSPGKSDMTWLITLTPSEQTAAGEMPNEFEMSLVVLRRRDRLFDAAPLSVTNGEKYPVDERIAYATSTSTNNATVPFWKSGASSFTLADLPSSTGGTMELKLWGAELTDPKIVPGTWVMLSRRIALGGDTSQTYANPKLIHRHRWFRVIGVDNRETWPRIVRVAGSDWDYPEANSSTVSVFNGANPSHLLSAMTTVTVLPSVEAVYRSKVTLR
jgi:hypothetical protein